MADQQCRNRRCRFGYTCNVNDRIGIHRISQRIFRKSETLVAKIMIRVSGKHGGAMNHSVPDIVLYDCFIRFHLKISNSIL